MVTVVTISRRTVQRVQTVQVSIVGRPLIWPVGIAESKLQACLQYKRHVRRILNAVKPWK
jgi:hypothetical protein